MGNTSPTKLILTSILLVLLSLKLKQDYLYISYAAIFFGAVLFIVGTIKFFRQRNG